MQTIRGHNDQIEIIKGRFAAVRVSQLDISKLDKPMSLPLGPHHAAALDLYPPATHQEIVPVPRLMFSSPASVAACSWLRIQNLSLRMLPLLFKR